MGNILSGGSGGAVGAEMNAEEAKKASHWEAFYAKASVALEPSSFAQLVVDKGFVGEDTKLVDIGCGNGRDSLHFARQGVETLGIDASTAAIGILNGTVHPHATFRALDIKDPAFLCDLADRSAFYMRFLLHAVTKAEEDRIFAVLAKAPKGSRVFAEFRTLKDPLMQKGDVVSANERIHGHYRRFLDVEDIVGRLATAGFTNVVLKSEEGNLSPPPPGSDDNPVLGRIVATKP